MLTFQRTLQTVSEDSDLVSNRCKCNRHFKPLAPGEQIVLTTTRNVTKVSHLMFGRKSKGNLEIAFTFVV